MSLGLIGIKTEVFNPAAFGNHCNYTEYILFPVITSGTGIDKIDNCPETSFNNITDFINDVNFRGNNKVEYGNKVVRIININNNYDYIKLKKAEVDDLIDFPIKTNCIIRNLGEDILKCKGFFIDNIHTGLFDNDVLYINTEHATFNEITGFAPHYNTYHKYDLLRFANPSIASNVLKNNGIAAIPSGLSKSTIICNGEFGTIHDDILFWYTRKDSGCNLKLKHKIDLDYKLSFFNKEDKDMVSYSDHTTLTSNANYPDHTTLIKCKIGVDSSAGDAHSITINPLVTPLFLSPEWVPIKIDFNIKNVKFSGDKVIVFWEDNTKTIVTMDDSEPTYDVEKAIMAAFTKRALSLMGTAKKRSLDNMLSKWTKKYESEKDTIKAQIEKIKKRRAKKKTSNSDPVSSVDNNTEDNK